MPDVTPFPEWVSCVNIPNMVQLARNGGLQGVFFWQWRIRWRTASKRSNPGYDWKWCTAFEAWKGFHRPKAGLPEKALGWVQSRVIAWSSRNCNWSETTRFVVVQKQSRLAALRFQQAPKKIFGATFEQLLGIFLSNFLTFFWAESV